MGNGGRSFFTCLRADRVKDASLEKEDVVIGEAALAADLIRQARVFMVPPRLLLLIVICKTLG